MEKTQTTLKNGITLKIGDCIGFKSDIEQGGKIIKIESGGGYGRGDLLTLENEYGFSGDYIGGETITQIDAADGFTE